MKYTFYERTDDDTNTVGQATVSASTVTWQPKSEEAIQMLANLHNWRFDGKFDSDSVEHWKLLPELIENSSRFFVVVDPTKVTKKNIQVTLHTSL